MSDMSPEERKTLNYIRMRLITASGALEALVEAGAASRCRNHPESVSEQTRIRGKVEGVKLAISYIEEELR